MKLDVGTTFSYNINSVKKTAGFEDVLSFEINFFPFQMFTQQERWTVKNF